MTLDELADRFEGARQSGEHYRARCPVHGSRGLTLSLAEGEQGLVIHCFAGCDPAAVLASVGLRLDDLFPREEAAIPLRPVTFPPDAQAERIAVDLREQAARYELSADELWRQRMSHFGDFLPRELDRLRARVYARLRGAPWTAAQLEEVALARDWDYEQVRSSARALMSDQQTRVLSNVFAERCVRIIQAVDAAEILPGENDAAA
jgi:hypothetical protein